MDNFALDFVPWGLEAAWPTRSWVEPIHGLRQDPPRGIRLGHASDAAMVLTCTFPRRKFDAEDPQGSSSLIDKIGGQGASAYRFTQR